MIRHSHFPRLAFVAAAFWLAIALTTAVLGCSRTTAGTGTLPTVVSTVPPPASPAGADTSGGSAAPGPYAPNEQGRIMVLEYHVIGSKEGRWQRTPEHFRQDLLSLYTRGYRPVNMSDVVLGNMRLARGYSPVVLTFDDGTEGQFRYIERDGRRLIDPDSAVGMLIEFHRQHPDWALKASFYVNSLPFGQNDSWKEKIAFLLDQGMEVGNHTLTHADLSRLDAAATTREIGGLSALLSQAVTGYQPVTLALPFGSLPRSPEAAKQGVYGGHPYQTRAFLLVGSDPMPSPSSPQFNPWRIPRIQVVDPAFESSSNFAYWLRYFDQHPDRRYVSAGDR